MKQELVLVAVGSTRQPKVRAVGQALSRVRESFPTFLEGGFEIVTREVPSGTAATPRSTLELMTGARARAERVRTRVETEGRRPLLALGLEGGVLSERATNGAPVPLLEAWAYASDGERGYFGSSGCVPLPSAIDEAVRLRGEELGAAADRHYGLENVAAGQGTFGVLTGDLVTREEAFVRALLHALAPFYNPSAY